MIIKIKMKPMRIRAILLMFPLLSGCASISTFQTGKITPRHSLEAGGALGGGTAKTKRSLLNLDIELPAFLMDMWLRYGFAKDFDAGGKISFPGYAFLDVRYGFLKEGPSHPLSAALGAGYGLTTASINKKSAAGTVEDKIKLEDKTATLHLSKDLTSKAALYLSPRIIWRHTRNSKFRNGTLERRDDFNDILLGAGAGLAFALPKLRLMLEADSIQDDNESGHGQTYFGIGFAVPLEEIF